jgi:hypothetical protein
LKNTISILKNCKSKESNETLPLTLWIYIVVKVYVHTQGDHKSCKVLEKLQWIVRGVKNTSGRTNNH